MMEEIKDINEVKEKVRNYLVLKKENNVEYINKTINLINHNIKILSIKSSIDKVVFGSMKSINNFNYFFHNKFNKNICYKYDVFLENNIQSLKYQKKKLKELKRSVAENKGNNKLTLQLYMMYMLLYYNNSKDNQIQNYIKSMELKPKGINCVFSTNDFSEFKTKKIIRKISDKLNT